jgi:molybdopterin-dependent oxidoreductase alpha subunit
MTRVKRGWNPRHWASLKPFGVGEQHPNNYLELVRALQENRDQLPYAWRILNQGVCDGCALGTTGMHDWTLDGIHLCNIRLRLLRLNTMPALDPAILGDVAPLRQRKPNTLRELGRLPFPMLRRVGEAGFQRISWDAALDLAAEQIRATSPDRLGFYLTSRGIPNETYYVAQKAARALGTNNIDNAARLCHAPSTVALKGSLGVGATTCSYIDWLETDLIVFIGSNIANNQPVATKYLHYAKKSGAQVAVVNSYREPGMDRYWVPSIIESGLFGTKLTDRFFMVDVGGDVAFLNGVLKHMIAEGWLDRQFIQQHTDGFAELARMLDAQSWEQLERGCGASRQEMLALATMIGQANRAIFVWSMGVTQHENGEDAVRAILNLVLSKGFVGRNGCGAMPIRGHSGVQGGAEMGAYTNVLPGGIANTPEAREWIGQIWGFEVPEAPGMNTPQMIDAADRGAMDVLIALGGNFLEVMPDPQFVEQALARVPLRIHIDIVVSSQMLVDPGQMVMLLPAMTRYEIAGGVTETSTERRVIFSPEIVGPRIGEARPEWQMLLDLARRARPERARFLQMANTAMIRAEIAQVIPFYQGIEQLAKQGDQFQYGGRHLCADWQFPTADGLAHFATVPLPTREVLPPGTFRLTTRRGKQFNTIVHEAKDAITGAGRDAIFIGKQDAERLGIQPGDRLIVQNELGQLQGRAFIAPIQPGNLQVHWPEGNVLLDRNRRSAQSGIPDYNATVQLQRAETKCDV